MQHSGAQRRCYGSGFDILTGKKRHVDGLTQGPVLGVRTRLYRCPADTLDGVCLGHPNKDVEEVVMEISGRQDASTGY